MGLDRFANFISKSINNDGIEELNINNNIRKIITNHVIFDLNFLIYQEIIEIENEVNDIIKIILSLPYSTNHRDFLEDLIYTIFNNNHWKSYTSNINDIFDGYNEDEIINKFINYLSTNINTNLSIIEIVIYEKIINVIIDYINKIHNIDFIQTINIFFDGIPSISKVIEQRRRRIKNYLESNEKKRLFRYYFDNLLNNNKNLIENLSKKYNINYENINIQFDYFKWIKNRFSIDKSIGPSSNFIKNLEVFINIKLTNYFEKIKININSASENGESDLKIFKYISINDNIIGDYSIHTTDSDLIHQILVQQSYYKIINKDINLSVIKYLKSHNMLGYVQVIEAPSIIKNILDLYNNINHIKTNNYKIIWDLCIIFYFFGNDHLPSSLEIGPELGLEYYIKTHYNSLDKNNIVNLKKGYISLDLNNLLLYLEKINENKKFNITKIILQRYFKINIQLINLFIDKFNFDFNQILDFLKKFILFKSSQINIDELDEDDLRKKLYVNQNIDLSSFGFDENNTKILLESFNLIENNIDYCESEFMGLILYNKPIILTNDQYQDIYNFISDKAINNLTKKYSDFYDHIDIHDHLHLFNNSYYNSNDYLKKIFHLTFTQFGCMKDYHTNNLTFYKYNNVPFIDELISYIKNINNHQTSIWFKEIKDENVLPDNYLNSINHHLLITPFILSYSIPTEIKNIISEMQHIPNLWLENIKEFKYRNIDINLFFKIWTETIIRINLNNKNNKINNELVNINFDII